MTPADPRLPDALRDLAHQVRRLLPHWSDPEKFHVAKSDIADQLRRLAQRAEGDRR